MTSISIAEAIDNFYELTEKVNNHSAPLLIINDKGQNCYLVGEKDLNTILETMHLNSIDGLVKSIFKEAKRPRSEATPAKDLDW